jgi:hypothetical protein
MDWSAVWTELPKAVPPLVGACVGGLLAVAGGVVGQYLTHRYARARDAEKLIREKAEQLIHELYANRHWFATQHDSLFLADSYHTDPSPLDRAYAIQSLYFPKLRQHLDAILRVEIQLDESNRIQRESQSQDRKAWLERRDQIMEERGPIYEAFTKVSDAAVAAVVTALEKQRDA